jgi:multiple sugar transport system permease protein
MATLTTARATPAATAPRTETMRRVRIWAIRVLVYALLTGTALLMLFPFLYMVFTSLKTTTDVFVAPPRLFPYSAVTTEFQGEQVPLYEIEVNGETRVMVSTGESVRFGFFTTPDRINAADPRSSSLVAQVPLENAMETGETQTVGDETFDVYEVPLDDGSTQQLLLAYRGGLTRFVDPQDPGIEAFANERTAAQVERFDPQWGNYEAVITLGNLGRSLINTTLVTIGVTIGQVTTSLLGGYAFSRMNFRGRDAVFLVYLGTIMIPFVVLIIPLYQLMVLIGWQDRLVSLILPWIFTAYGTFLMRQFFISIPKELEEAAFLDGLSRLGILLRIFVPLSGPAIATQAIITFLYAWNSFVWPLIIIGDSPIENHVLTLSMIQLQTNYSSQPNLVLTGAAVAVLPPLILFMFAQRYFVEGVANTGMK